MPNKHHEDQPAHKGQEVDTRTRNGPRYRARLDLYVPFVAPCILLLAPSVFIQPAQANDAFNIGIASAQVEYATEHCGKLSIGRFKSIVEIAKRGNRALFNEGRDAQSDQLIEQQKFTGIASVCKALLASPLSTFLKDKR